MGRHPWDTTGVSDGLYDLRVVTTDNVGNTFTSATITNVRVDNTAPNNSLSLSSVSPSGSADNPEISVLPGHSFTYHLYIPRDQPLGTFWYHEPLSPAGFNP